MCTVTPRARPQVLEHGTTVKKLNEVEVACEAAQSNVRGSADAARAAEAALVRARLPAAQAPARQHVGRAPCGARHSLLRCMGPAVCRGTEAGPWSFFEQVSGNSILDGF